MANDTALRGRLAIVLGILVMAIYHKGYSCTPPKKWNNQEVGKRAAIADIVIVGKVIASSHHAQTKERKLGRYTARFMVICTLKGAPLPAFVDVSGFGLVPGHCVDSRALLNRTYIGLLRQRKDRYSVAEVNMQRATVPFKPHILRRVSRKLGLEYPHYCLANVLENGSVETKKLVRNSGTEDAEKEAQTSGGRTRTIETLPRVANAALREESGRVAAAILVMIYCLCYVST